MALSSDLLKQAELLARHDRRRPKQANLRRAVSAAYYSLFHLFVSECTHQLLSARLPRARSALARVFTHAEMAQACRLIVDSAASIRHLFPDGTIPDTLVSIAESFVDLQQARHEADYNVGRAFTRSDTLLLVASARRAFRNWRLIRNSESAQLFLVALLAPRMLKR